MDALFPNAVPCSARLIKFFAAQCSLFLPLTDRCSIFFSFSFLARRSGTPHYMSTSRLRLRRLPTFETFETPGRPAAPDHFLLVGSPHSRSNQVLGWWLSIASTANATGLPYSRQRGAPRSLTK